MPQRYLSFPTICQRSLTPSRPDRVAVMIQVRTTDFEQNTMLFEKHHAFRQPTGGRGTKFPTACRQEHATSPCGASRKARTRLSHHTHKLTAPLTLNFWESLEQDKRKPEKRKRSPANPGQTIAATQILSHTTQGIETKK